jgi:hypothetical protein
VTNTGRKAINKLVESTKFVQSKSKMGEVRREVIHRLVEGVTKGKMC